MKRKITASARVTNAKTTPESSNRFSTLWENRAAINRIGNRPDATAAKARRGASRKSKLRAAGSRKTTCGNKVYKNNLTGI